LSNGKIKGNRERRTQTWIQMVEQYFLAKINLRSSGSVIQLVKAKNTEKAREKAMNYAQINYPNVYDPRQIIIIPTIE